MQVVVSEIQQNSTKYDHATGTRTGTQPAPAEIQERARMRYIVEPPDGKLIEFDASDDKTAIVVAQGMLGAIDLRDSSLFEVALNPLTGGETRRGVKRFGEPVE